MKDPHEMGVKVFLTAYDPSDLPGGSVDPLGFERGYLFLADKILPGMTNVAQCPRYFAVLCAGAKLAQVDADDPPRKQYDVRRETILRLERLWVLANVLAAKQDSNMGLSGLRGVMYAQRYEAQLAEAGASHTSGKYRLLSRQMPYGVIGMYGSVAEGLRLLSRDTFELTPDLGERLAVAFIEETKIPRSVQKAATEDEDAEVSLGVLADWGGRAWLWGKPGDGESKCIEEMITFDSIRCRFSEILARHPLGNQEMELQRLNRIEAALAKSTADRDLWESLRCILAYERCYRVALLVLERLLHLCRNSGTGFITQSQLQDDNVLKRACGLIPNSVARLRRALAQAKTAHFQNDLDRLKDVRQFLDEAASASASPAQLAEAVLARHRDVQRGKFDNGRRKMPWIEMTDSRIALTTTRVGGSGRELTEPGQIPAHLYRTHSADAWNQGARRV